MGNDLEYMGRALELARHGKGHTSPNPMVGCVLVVKGRIVGEGWHRQYGGPHAEVQAIRDATDRGNETVLPLATAYVTLEPCSHHGKTPPCADLLIDNKIKRVVVANQDPNPLVAGRGIARLRQAGMEVHTGVLEAQGAQLNRRFFTYFTKKRPYIILKWAESADGYMAGEGNQKVQISNAYSSARVHRWRSEEDAILVGKGTALADNPRLNVRQWPGHHPVRIVLDRQLSLPSSLHLFDGTQPTLVYSYSNSTDFSGYPDRYSKNPGIAYAQLRPAADELPQVLEDLHRRSIQSVLVEGGAQVHASFLAAGLWDEIRRCQSPIRLGSGVKAPVPMGTLIGSEMMEDDLWTYYTATQARYF